MNHTVSDPCSRVRRCAGGVPASALAFRALVSSAVLAVTLGAPAYAAVASDLAVSQVAAPAAEAASERLLPQSSLRTLGSGAQTFYVVEHGHKISIYVNGVPADYILEQLRSVGGPTYSTRVGLTRAITMSLHRVTWRAMFERILNGLNLSYHYKGWRISHIRVLGLVPGRSYQVAPRPAETKDVWMQAEIGTDHASGAVGATNRGVR